MLILTSDGLSSKNLLLEAKKYIKPGSKVLFVTTASGMGSHDHSLPSVRAEMHQLGASYTRSDDLSKRRSLAFLKQYDVIEFLGGNPFILLKRLRELDASPLLHELVATKVIIGYSAGSIVMQHDIGIFDHLKKDEGDMNRQTRLSDFTGFGFTAQVIIPHWQYLTRAYPSYRRIIKNYQRKHDDSILYLKDGEGLFIVNNHEYIISGDSRNNI